MAEKIQSSRSKGVQPRLAQLSATDLRKYAGSAERGKRRVKARRELTRRGIDW